MLYADYEEEEQATSEYKPPVLKRRATVGHDYTAPASKPPTVPQKKSNKHPLFSVGIGMCFFVFLLYIWNFVLVPWWVGINLQWHYGDNHVSLMGADVGHGGVSR